MSPKTSPRTSAPSISAHEARSRFDEARREVDLAVGHYEQEREGLGMEFFEDYEHTLEGIRKGLLPGSPVTGQKSRHRLVRVKFRRFPYKFIVAVFAAELGIVAVAHNHREPAYWLERLKP